jgi:hypothetical protein
LIGRGKINGTTAEPHRRHHRNAETATKTKNTPPLNRTYRSVNTTTKTKPDPSPPPPPKLKQIWHHHQTETTKTPAKHQNKHHHITISPPQHHNTISSPPTTTHSKAHTKTNFHHLSKHLQPPPEQKTNFHLSVKANQDLDLDIFNSKHRERQNGSITKTTEPFHKSFTTHTTTETEKREKETGTKRKPPPFLHLRSGVLVRLSKVWVSDSYS